MQNDKKIKYIVYLGSQNIKQEADKPLPQCKLCFNKYWHPKVILSFDFDTDKDESILGYYCDCKNTMIKIYEEANNAE